MCVCVCGLCVRQVSQRCVRRPQEPVFLLHGRLSAAALQVDQRFGLQEHAAPAPGPPLLLVPAVEDVDPVGPLGAARFRTGGAGEFEVDRVHRQALPSQAGVLGQGGQQFLHHRAGVPAGARARAREGGGGAAAAAAVGARNQTEVLDHAAATATAAVRRGATRRVAPVRVAEGAGRAAPGLGRARGAVAHGAAHPLQREHGVGLDGAGGEVHVDGCGGDDLGDGGRRPSIWKTSGRPFTRRVKRDGRDSALKEI